MLASLAAVAASFVAATASHAMIEGTVASVSALPASTALSVTTRLGAAVVVDVPTAAVVRERAEGGDWHAIGAAALDVGEPVRIAVDGSGRAVEVDAEYAVVYTRAVTMQSGQFIGTDGVVRRFVGSALSGSAIPLGAYVQLRTDPETGAAYRVASSSHPFATVSGANAVAVTFSVRVPVNTPASATVYMATNTLNWTANAIRMNPQPGNVWSVTVQLAAGTVFQYKYTRGAWSVDERDTSGSEIPSRTLTITSAAKAQMRSDVVARWADLPS